MEVLKLEAIGYSKPVVTRMLRALKEKSISQLAADQLTTRLNNRLKHIEFKDEAKGIVINRAPEGIEVTEPESVVVFFLHLGVQNQRLDTSHFKPVPSKAQACLVYRPEKTYKEALNFMVEKGY